MVPCLRPYSNLKRSKQELARDRHPSTTGLFLMSLSLPVAPSQGLSGYPKHNNTNNTRRNNNNSSRKRGRAVEERNGKRVGIEIDFDETVKEIHTLGSTQFTGKQKREYQEEQHKTLTGRAHKKQKVPLKIVRGIKKKAAQREKGIEQENRDAGIVTASTNKKKVNKGYSEKNRTDSRIHGPAPTIGFTKKGVLSVRKDKR